MLLNLQSKIKNNLFHFKNDISFKYEIIILLFLVLVVFLGIFVTLGMFGAQRTIKESTPIAVTVPSEGIQESSSPSSTFTPAITTPTKSMIVPKLIFGIGSEADGAINTRLIKETKANMLTSWYNGPNDLPWMSQWKDNFIPALYAKGYTLHLITFTEKPEGEVDTSFGKACGRSYPVSNQVVEDMRKIASTFAGSGKLYVTLFTEFQTYPCEDNKWVGNENYYNQLKSNYRAIKEIFHQEAPNSQVGISWGGWQSRWTDVDGGGGRALIPYFADIIKESDITSFQAMESGSNIDDIQNMTAILGAYGKPVVLSHYKPDNRAQETFNNDVRAVLTESYLRKLTSNGLVAMSFMDKDNMENDELIFQFIKNAVRNYQK